MKQGIVILAVAVIAGVAFVVTKNNDKPAQQTNSGTTNQQQSSPPASSSEQNQSTEVQNATKEIAYSDEGFTPNTLTVKSGDTVTIMNKSSDVLQFDSDPHPQHTANPELNVETVASSESKTFKVTRTGTHGYHNHLNARDTGTITVE